MTLPSPLRDKLGASLEIHTEVLREGLRLALAERTFPAHPSLGSNTERRVLGPQDVQAVRVVYDFPGFEPVICGLSRTGSFRAGSRRLPGLRDRDLFDPSVEAALLKSQCFESELAALQCLGEVQSDLFEQWVIAAWREVRAIAPDIRGFVSEHDTIWMTDMDTSEQTTEEAVGLRYL